MALTGPQGSKGQKGQWAHLQGPQGQKGQKGWLGPQGSSPQGSKGQKGQKGVTGPQGSSPQGGWVLKVLRDKKGEVGHHLRVRLRLQGKRSTGSCRSKGC